MIGRLAWSVLLWPLVAIGGVRDVVMDDSMVANIYLCLGRSTVLRFRETPQRLVVGNKNHFNFDFVANDVTIQPLSGISSNLFVYGEFYNYAFDLKFSGCQRHDGLVKVARKALAKKEGTPRQFAIVAVDRLKVMAWPPVRASIGKVWMVDLSIFNNSRNPVKARDIVAILDGIGKGTQELVIAEDSIGGGYTVRGRIVFRTAPNGHLALTIGFKGSVTRKKVILKENR